MFFGGMGDLTRSGKDTARLGWLDVDRADFINCDVYLKVQEKGSIRGTNETSPPCASEKTRGLISLNFCPLLNVGFFPSPGADAVRVAVAPGAECALSTKRSPASSVPRWSGTFRE